MKKTIPTKVEDLKIGDVFCNFPDAENYHTSRVRDLKIDGDTVDCTADGIGFISKRGEVVYVLPGVKRPDPSPLTQMFRI